MKLQSKGIFYFLTRFYYFQTRLQCYHRSAGKSKAASYIVS